MSYLLAALGNIREKQISKLRTLCNLNKLILGLDDKHESIREFVVMKY